MSLFYNDIRFSSSVNEGHSVDTQFCTHDLIKENDLNDHPCTTRRMTWMTIHIPQIASHESIGSCITCINLSLHYMHQLVFALHASTCLCITCINSFITYYKNDLEILMVTIVFLVFKSGNRIERYRMISVCTVNMHCV